MHYSAAFLLERLGRLAEAADEWRFIIGWCEEHDATIAHTVGSAGARPDAPTALPGLFLAGDWTATGLPATLESAVRSGRRAADFAARYLRAAAAAAFC